MTKFSLPKRFLYLAVAATSACASQPPAQPANHADLGIQWVRDAAEYRALSLQAYAAAAEDLPRMLEDTSWSALPDQAPAANLPPAIIFDVDETLVSNVEFQVAFEPPFANYKLDDWNATHKARPVPGAAAFIEFARTAGVTTFFITNRPCEPKPSVEEFCPQEDVTIEDLVEIGIPADAEHVMLAREKPAWTREKKIRRDLVAENYRVIMLVGDDLGDFLPCVRNSVVAPCTEPATQAGRQAKTETHGEYWGDGWYILPNPMHGSWTSVE